MLEVSAPAGAPGPGLSVKVRFFLPAPACRTGRAWGGGAQWASEARRRVGYRPGSRSGPPGGRRAGGGGEPSPGGHHPQPAHCSRVGAPARTPRVPSSQLWPAPRRALAGGRACGQVTAPAGPRWLRVRCRCSVERPTRGGGAGRGGASAAPSPGPGLRFMRGGSGGGRGAGTKVSCSGGSRRPAGGGERVGRGWQARPCGRRGPRRRRWHGASARARARVCVYARVSRRGQAQGWDWDQGPLGWGSRLSHRKCPRTSGRILSPGSLPAPGPFSSLTFSPSLWVGLCVPVQPAVQPPRFLIALPRHCPSPRQLSPPFPLPHLIGQTKMIEGGRPLL